MNTGILLASSGYGHLTGDGNVDTNNGTAGGGEVLQYIGQNNTNVKDMWMFDSGNIAKQQMIPVIVAIAVVLLVALALYAFIRIYKVRLRPVDKAITNSTKYAEEVRKRDQKIIDMNNLVNRLTGLVQRTVLRVDKTQEKYWDYILVRADIKLPGNNKHMKFAEVNMMIRVAQAIMVVISLLVAIFANVALGTIMIIASWIGIQVIVKQILQSSAKAKDDIIVDNFSDMYLMLHYGLVKGKMSSLATSLRAYDKTTTEPEMHRFVDVCCSYIDTYGEFEATQYITKEYREIKEVGKLMKLIREANMGGDVRTELIGFRSEIIKTREYNMERNMDKTIAKAKASFFLVYIILFQAVISAMAIYFKDMGAISNFL